MPFVTIAAGATAVIGNADPGPAITGARKSLVLNLESGDARWGWTATVTAAGADDAGVPLTAGNPIAFDAESLRMNATLRVFSVAGCTLTYQENRHL